MTAPLTALECELLEAIAGGRDETAMSVLADYWIENVDEARGAFVHLQCGENARRLDLADEEARLGQFARAWRSAATAAGYAEQDLMLLDGFLQWPICVRADDPLDGHPDIVRISPRYYRWTKCLRVGLDCMVFEAQAVTPRTLTRVAIKSIGEGPARRDEVSALLDHEFVLLRSVDHPNVVRALGYTIRPEGRALVLSWCGIDLRKLIALARAHGRTLGIDFAIAVAVQLLDALVAIQRANIVHGEVRSEHVAVACDGTVSLIDFGFARQPNRPPPRPDYYLSPGIREDMSYRYRYLSPEQCRGMELDGPSDVFSAAGLICELVTNEHPTPRDGSDFALIQYIMQGQIVVPPELPAHFRFPLASAFEPSPTNRITAADLRATLIAGARLSRLDISRELIARRLLELGVPA